jgi:hypothetical protein
MYSHSRLMQANNLFSDLNKYMIVLGKYLKKQLTKVTRLPTLMYSHSRLMQANNLFSDLNK